MMNVLISFIVLGTLLMIGYVVFVLLPSHRYSMRWAIIERYMALSGIALIGSSVLLLIILYP